MSSPSGVEASGVRIALLHPLRAWLDGLQTVLLSYRGMHVVVARTTADWVRPAITEGCADLLLISLDRPDAGTGPELIASLRSARPDLGVVALSDAEDPRSLATAVRVGVRGWVRNMDTTDRLVSVIRGVAGGETWFPERLMTLVLDGLLADERSREEAAAVLAPLSGREVDVLRCLVQGLTRYQIAQLYVLSPNTVRTHINNLLRKLDVHSTLAAVSLARQAGLCEPDSASDQAPGSR